MGPGLYNCADDEELNQCLAKHPYSSSNNLASVNFIEEIALIDEHELNGDLATLVNDIRIEDLYGIQIDGTQVYDIELLMDENELVSPLHFKKTSTGITVDSDIPIYLLIPQDWYRGPTETPHAQQKD